MHGTQCIYWVRTERNEIILCMQYVWYIDLLHAVCNTVICCTPVRNALVCCMRYSIYSFAAMQQLIYSSDACRTQRIHMVCVCSTQHTDLLHALYATYSFAAMHRTQYIIHLVAHAVYNSIVWCMQYVMYLYAACSMRYMQCTA
jgi:hypothetical protein